MITPIPQKSLAHARRYFREHLRVGDYYAENETVDGEWFGEGAERLQLKGKVSEKEFLALCEGENPFTGESLTARKNDVRTENGTETANRRVFYDFVFRPPKSVSIMAYLQDERILALHRKAVRSSLAALECFAETRVRRDGACSDRRTGNIVAALFEHDTSREQDPLLHTHAVVFNATWDKVEGRWKALQSREMFRALAYADGVYNTEMTRELVRLGYDIQTVGKAWEISGVTRDVIEKFSKRRTHIERRLAEEMAKPANRNADPHRIRERIAREERKRKIRNADRRKLVKKWRRELGDARLQVLAALKPAVSAMRSKLPKPDYATVLVWAKLLVFERKSVVRFHELLAAASRRLLGTDSSMDALSQAAVRSGILQERDGERITSAEGLRREWAIVERAKRERGSHRAFVAVPDLSASSLDDEQRSAVASLLQSRDGVTLFRGAAGSGKSHALAELVRQLEAAGRTVRVATPQAQQARALTSAGTPTVTLAKLLAQAELPLGAVVVIDEAGQVGGRQMEAVFDLARRHAARVILSGDTRQHTAVEASDAMRMLESYAGVTTAEVKRIRRQDPRLGRTEDERRGIENYRRAVMDASEGQAESALARLRMSGFIREAENVVDATATEFERLHAEGLHVLAVSQTRETVREVNDAIVERLVARGEIRDVRPVEAFAPRDAQAAEKLVGETYAPGAILRMVRDYGSLERGDLVDVVDVEDDALTVSAGDRVRRRVSLKYAERWEVLERQELRIGIGSVVQLKANGTSLEGRAIVNGELVTVEAFEKNDVIRVRDREGNSKRLGREERVMQLGYAVTSYGSQGQTADAVLLADSGVAAASHRKEWYVSISRARRKIRVFTPSVPALASRIAASGDRMLGLELVPDVRHLLDVGARAAISDTVRRARRVGSGLRNQIRP